MRPECPPCGRGGFGAGGSREGSGDPDLEERAAGGVLRCVSEGTGGVGLVMALEWWPKGQVCWGPWEDQGVGWLVSRARVLAPEAGK